jgi:hypothetical protein
VRDVRAPANLTTEKMPRKKISIGIAILIVVVLAALFIGPKQTSNENAPEATTAVLKPVSDGPDYLRLEQIHSTVIARFLLTCIDERVYWNAGIVTTPELSSSKLKLATKNYLEIDDEQVLIAQGSAGAEVADSTIWIFRPLGAEHVTALKKANVLGAWTEDGGDFRWGAFMNIDNVRSQINSYLDGCKE